MRSWILAGGIATLAAAGVLQQPDKRPYTIIVGGDTDGYLAPCGCSTPMVGGIKRRATAVKLLWNPGRTIFLENGGLVSGTTEQDHIKADTLAFSLAEMKATAINYGPSEARLGAGTLLSLKRESGDKFVSSSVAKSETNELRQFILAGHYLIGGVSTQPDLVAAPIQEQPISVDSAVRKLVDDADQGGVRPILMLQGSHEDAVRVAKDFPSLALIEYQRSGDPPDKPEWVGATLLVTPGEGGRNIVRVDLKSGGGLAGYEVKHLGPEFSDDKEVAVIYKSYLRRIEDADLLGKLPRTPGPAYVGSAACAKCHAQAYSIWHDGKFSGHSRALTTLEKVGHSKDPDCVGCHVVGLSHTPGFVSRKATPLLANVGCESCHGAGAAHSASPKAVKMGKVGQQICVTCHTALNSPRFDFATYWSRIKHK